MRIAIVINTSWNIFNFRKSLVQALMKEGHTLVAIAPKDAYSEKLREWGMEFYPITINNKGSNPLQELWQIRRFYKVYQQAQLDLVLQYTIKPNIYGTLAAKLLNIPTINNVSGLGTVFLHDNWVSAFAKQLYKYAFQYPKKVFFQNPDDQQAFIQRNLVNPAITGILPGSGINLDEFTYSPLPHNNPTTFLFVARLLYDKGIIEFLEAIAKLRSHYNFKVVICGKLEPEAGLGITKKELQQHLEQGNIRYLGHIDNISQEIEKADCIVLPSYREGTPRSLLEAAALGRPIITTQVPGCKEVVDDYKNGLLCKVKDSQSLADKMAEFLELNLEQRQNMGLASRKLAETKFDDKFVIAAYCKIIETIN